MKHKILYILSLLLMLVATSACSDSKSYAELLSDEDKLVNAFLAEHRVCEEFPGVDECEVGIDAPYYKVDDDGNVYMQVLMKGDGEFPETNDLVCFRYVYYDLNYYVVGSDDNIGYGNVMPGNADHAYFLFDNYTIDVSYQYGTGIQIPVSLLGYGCKVNVVIKSQAGLTSTMSYVIPYLYNVFYWKPVMDVTM